MSRKSTLTKTAIFSFCLVLFLGLSGCERLRNYSDQEHVQRAKDFQSKGDFKAAGIELKNALNKNAKNAEARWLLGEIYLELSQGAAAEKELKRAQELGISAESLRVPLGRAYLMQGKQKQVLDEIHPTQQTSERGRAQILKLRGDALLGTRRGKEACGLYTQANQADANFVDAYWGLSLCATALENDEKRARALLDQALKLEPKNAESWAKIAEWEQTQPNVEKAEAAYNEAIKLKPHYRNALFNRSLIFLATNRIGEAEKDVAALRRHAPQTAETLFMEGTLHYYKKEYDKAQAALGKLEKYVPNYPPAILLNAMVAYITHSYGAAEQYIGRYLAFRPRDEKALRLKARIYLQTKRPSLALETLTPLLKTPEPDRDLLALVGQTYMQLRDYTKATQYLERAASIDPKNVAAQSALARGYLAGGQDDRGISVLQMASDLDPAQGEADILLAMHYLRTTQNDKALGALASLERKEPNNPILHNLRGHVYSAKGDLAQARKHWEKSLEVSPTYLLAATNLARIDIKDKKIDSAKKRYLNVLEKDPNNIDAMIALADIAVYEKHKTDNLKWLERAASTDRKAIAPRTRLVAHYLANRNPQQALSIAREAAASNPGDVQALDLLGRAQFEAGEYENAQASYKQLVERAPDSIAARVGLAGVQMVLRRFDDARANLSQALKAHPNNLGLLQSMVALLIEQGKLDDAAGFARQAQLAHPKLAAGFVMEGDVRGLQKRWAESVQVYERGFSLEPNTAVISRLHAALVRGGQSAQADARFLQWIKGHAADAPARTYLAESYMRRGMKPQAIEQYEAVLQLNPNQVIAMNNLAGIYLEMKDPRAQKYAEKAYSLAPDSPAIMDTYGWVLVNQGQASKGLDLLGKAKFSAPSALTIHYHYAVALEKTGQTAKAKQELQALLLNKRPFPERTEAEQLLINLAAGR